MSKAKTAFRYADLNYGDEFADTTYHDVYTVGNCDLGGNSWRKGSGYSKKYFADNAEIIPCDRATVARRKCSAYRKLAKKFGLTYRELQSGYRLLVAQTARPYQTRLTIGELDSPLKQALEHCGLIFQHGGKFYVSGDNNRLFL